MAANDTCGIFLLSGSGEYSISSMSDSSLSESLVASHLYKFLVSFPLAHLCLGSHFWPQRLHLPSFILRISKLVFSPSQRCGGTYFVLSVFASSQLGEIFVSNILFQFSSTVSLRASFQQLLPSIWIPL